MMESMADAVDKPIELTVVMPCLNEAETLATCVDKATAALRENGIQGEVVVADNGSTDGSQEIATAHGRFAGTARRSTQAFVPRTAPMY